MTDNSEREAKKTRMREGFEEQRRVGMNVDWFTWQIAWHDALFTELDIAGEPPQATRQPAAATLGQIAGDLWDASINCDFDAFKVEVAKALPAAATGQETIYQTRWSQPGNIWGDVTKDAYDDYLSFGYAARRIVYAHPASEPKALTDEQIDAIMEQVQVFASAWSMVGGVFDSGNVLETAEEEKKALRAMLRATDRGNATASEGGQS